MSRDPDRIEIEADRPYGRVGDRELRCDVYYAHPSDAPPPAVVLIHGGGWRRGDRAAMRGYGIRLAKRGYTCVSIEYRLTPEARWPAQIHDVKRAIRFVRESAGKLGVDGARIAVQGSSAGAHLALLAAGTPGLAAFEEQADTVDVPTHVAAAVGVYTPTAFRVGDARVSGSVPAGALLGSRATEEAAREAAPLSHVNETFPPTLLFHGTADQVVPPSASVRMYEALAAAGVPVGLHMYPQQPHGFARRPHYQRLLSAEIATFLDEYVGTTPS